MRRPRRIRVLLVTVLLATFTKVKAEAAFADTLVEPTDLRNVITGLSNLHSSDRITKCVYGVQNKLCAYNGPAGLYYDVFPREQSNGIDNVQASKGHPDPFIDLTRLGELGNFQGIARSHPDDGSFSEDYLDINDLSAARSVDGNQLSPLNKQRREFNIVMINPDRKARYSRRLSNLTDPQLLSILRAQVKRYHSKEDSSSEDSDEEESKPKRFEVIEKTDSEDYRPPRVKAEGKYIYAQAPTRHLTLDRRRLPHFLPKRYHWSLEDIKHLPYLWFNGPQGQYAGIYRKPL